MFRRYSAESLRSLTPQRICVIKPSALGDVVQTLPLLPVLKDCYPDAEISWVINKGFANLLEGHPLLAELLIFDRRGTWASWGRLLRQLHARKFDLVFDLQGLLRTGVMTTATRAPIRVGLDTAREGSHRTVNCTIPDSSRNIPAHARNWRLAEVLGYAGWNREIQIPVSETDRSLVHVKLQSLKSPLLAISPGAQWITKRWPIEKYAEVAKRAVEQFGFGICLVGGPNERELCHPLEAQLRECVPGINLVNLAGETSLKQLAAVLERSDLLLTNDSGPMHLAAGLGTPVTGIFLCTDAIRSGPPPGIHELVSTSVDCRASYKKLCPCTGNAHMACMQELDVERVWAGLQNCVKKNDLITRKAA